MRAPRPHELDAVLGVNDAAFLAPLPPAERSRARATFAQGAMRVGAIEDEVVGVATHLELALTLPGAEIARARGLSSIAVLPTRRRQGVLRALVTDALAAAADAREPLCVLHASESAIYGRFGFGPCTYAASYELACPAALAPTPSPGRLHLFSRSEALACFPAVFDAYRRTRAGEVERARSWWEATFPAEAPAGAPARYFVAYDAGGRIDGYACYDVPAPGGDALARLDGGLARRRAHVVELVALDSSARCALWSYLLHLDLVDTVTTGARPVDEPLRHLLVDGRALRTVAVSDQLWCRVVDVGAALAARRYTGPGRLVLALTDELRPENSGTFSLECDPGGSGRVRRAEEAPSLECGVAALSAALCGGTSWGTLAAAGRVRERVPGACERADQLFLTRPAPFCTPDF